MANTPTAATDLALRDIHLPDPVSWWPLAPGWWIIVACLLFFIMIFYAGRKYYRSKALQRAANAELEKIKQQFARNKNQTALVQSLSVLLRRSCISFYPRHQCASLTGEAWLKYLDDTLPASAAQSSTFYQGVGECLASAPYMSESSSVNIDCDNLIALCETWILAQPVKSKTQRAD